MMLMEWLIIAPLLIAAILFCWFPALRLNRADADAAQQRALADRMTEVPGKKHQRRLAVLVDTIQIRLQQHANRLCARGY